MKAMVYHRYGGPEVVGLAEVPTPIAKDNEVLIRIVATTVTTGDWRARSLNLPGGFGFMGRPVFGMLFEPRQPILGTELSGVVEAIGKAVTRFAVGDEVFAFTGSHFGAHAEYRTIAAGRAHRPQTHQLVPRSCRSIVLRRHDGSDLPA